MDEQELDFFPDRPAPVSIPKCHKLCDYWKYAIKNSSKGSFSSPCDFCGEFEESMRGEASKSAG